VVTAAGASTYSVPSTDAAGATGQPTPPPTSPRVEHGQARLAAPPQGAWSATPGRWRLLRAACPSRTHLGHRCRGSSTCPEIHDRRHLRETRREILEAVRTHSSLTPKRLSEVAEVPYENAKKTMQRMAADGQLVGKGGTYSLPPQTDVPGVPLSPDEEAARDKGTGGTQLCGRTPRPRAGATSSRVGGAGAGGRSPARRCIPSAGPCQHRNDGEHLHPRFG
jgi:hypothetical protein